MSADGACALDLEADRVGRISRRLEVNILVGDIGGAIISQC